MKGVIVKDSLWPAQVAARWVQSVCMTLLRPASIAGGDHRQPGSSFPSASEATTAAKEPLRQVA